MHFAVHGESQQTPSWQFPDAQSLPAAQPVPLAPGGFIPQLPFTQLAPVQSLSVTQVVVQREPAASHLYGVQSIGAGVTQVPWPSHAEAVTSIAVPPHFARAQAIPGRYLRHPPLPSQVPS
jgi:hypothetical protein